MTYVRNVETELVRHSLAALAGVAVGDALGKMTEGYWPPEIESRYGGKVETFLPPQQPHSTHTWEFAEVTDDTRFTILVAESIVACGGVDASDTVRRIFKAPIKGYPILGWEESRKKVEAGEKNTRTGNGAPMRVAPIGILHSPSGLEELVKDVVDICSCTHNARSALSAACAIAADYSAAIEGFGRDAILDLAIEAAELGNQFGEDDLCPDVSRRLQWVRKNVGVDAKTFRGLNPGFEAWQGAVYALALVKRYHSARDAILAAVNVGGDADSIAAMAGGILAARRPDTLPAEWIAIVERENKLALGPLAEQLVALRK